MGIPLQRLSRGRRRPSLGQRQMACHRSRSLGVGARIIRRRKSLTPICHCSRDWLISLTLIINPAQSLRSATSVPSQIYPMRLRISPWLWFRYPEECHYTNWNVVARDVEITGTNIFGPAATATNNQCFSMVVGGDSVAKAVRTSSGTPPVMTNQKLYVGRVTVPNAFFNTIPSGLEDIPVGETRRDLAGNVMVFFDAENDTLPLDGSHCWLFRAGRLNQWFSNRDQ